MQALNIGMPSDSIGTACSRPGMPVKGKTAIMTLLLSTSDVPGTDGRKTAFRFDGHGNNFKFGASSFVVTLNFADTYSPLVVEFHEGPGKRIRLDICVANVVRTSGIRGAECIMLLLERRGTVAEPCSSAVHRNQSGACVLWEPISRAQAEFFLLMTELHYHFLIDLERLHIGRMVLAQHGVTTQDEVAASRSGLARLRRTGCQRWAQRHSETSR